MLCEDAWTTPGMGPRWNLGTPDEMGKGPGGLGKRWLSMIRHGPLSKGCLDSRIRDEASRIDGNQPNGFLRSMPSWIQFMPPFVASQVEMSAGHGTDFGFRLVREAPEAPAVCGYNTGTPERRDPRILRGSQMPRPRRPQAVFCPRITLEAAP